MDERGDGAGRDKGHVWRLAMSDFEGSETLRRTWFFHFVLFFSCVVSIPFPGALGLFFPTS